MFWKNPTYWRHQLSRPMRVVGPTQFWEVTWFIFIYFVWRSKLFILFFWELVKINPNFLRVFMRKQTSRIWVFLAFKPCRNHSMISDKILKSLLPRCYHTSSNKFLHHFHFFICCTRMPSFQKPRIELQ